MNYCFVVDNRKCIGCHAEAEMDSCHIRAAFRARDDVIEDAVLESEPERDWTEYEMRLRGKKVSEWINASRSDHG